jgi:5-methylcytosine-specific restriction endonuclease McrA
MNTLILTQEFQPHKVLTWDRAILMVFQGKVEVVEEYDEVLSVLDPARAKDFPHVARAYGQRFSAGDEIIIRMPSVLRLWRPVGRMKRGVKFSRVNVFTRDGFRCCYCGFKGGIKELNYDHLVPRHRGGKTVWENIVTSCYPCNSKKRNRTPDEAGMRLLQRPHKPKVLPMLGPRFDMHKIPVQWLGYLPNFGDSKDPASEVA